jgi:maltooligosyltrehalose trehalohydrolase
VTDGLSQRLPLGAARSGAGEWSFLVWAPDHAEVEVCILTGDGPDRHPMTPVGDGYYAATVSCLPGPPDYRFALGDSTELADPASRHQPQGVHGPSRAFDPSGFPWTDGGFAAVPLPDAVIYELHVGTFTAEGTFDAAVERLDDLVDLGVTAVEPMPLNAFPGARNWGYDGAFPFAVQESYGGPSGFQRFVDACHSRGLAVYLDVVYNHLGPEGVVHRSYGPYFTDAYATPGGAAMNFSEAGSDGVRRYFIDNAVMWCRDFHVDGLRVDAVHGIVDPTASPFLRELTDAVHAVGEEQRRLVVVIAESADNNPLVVAPPARGGQGFDAQWNDDFHHSVHALLTGERDGYYVDFGKIDEVVRAFAHGFVFRGEYSAFRRRRHGTTIGSVAPHQLVCFTQDHDQVGNRAGAERLSELVGPAKARLAAALLLLSPFVPMLFMGEEYAERAPFPYFVDHGDPELLDAVRKGRAEEFARETDTYDPAAESTYVAARLDWERRCTPDGARMLALYRALIAARRAHPVLHLAAAADRAVERSGDVLILTSAGSDETAVAMFNLGPGGAHVRLPETVAGGTVVLDSADVDGDPDGRTGSGALELDGYGFAFVTSRRVR